MLPQVRECEHDRDGEQARIKYPQATSLPDSVVWIVAPGGIDPCPVLEDRRMELRKSEIAGGVVRESLVLFIVGIIEGVQRCDIVVVAIYEAF